jgi:hypothetical protein
LASATLTRSTLTVIAGVRSYADVYIDGSIQDGGSNLSGLPFALKAKYTKTAFIPDVIHEGDRVTDSNSTVYDVHAVDEVWWLDQFIGYQAELFTLKTATLGSRSSVGVFTTSTIYMNLSVGGQSQLQPREHYGVNDYVGITAATLVEGNQITDEDGTVYNIMSVSKYPSARSDNFYWNIATLTPQFSAVTLGTLTLGAADTITGIYAASYATSTIRMSIAAKGQNFTRLNSGYYNRYDYVGVTDSSVLEGDQITDSASVTYEVMQVHSYPSARTDYTYNWYVCGLTKRDFATQPATSGTWHLDSTTLTTDVRSRHKILLGTYLTAANLKKDNGATAASYIVCFDGASYPVTRVFLTKAIDLIFSVGRGTTKALGQANKVPYAFDEVCPVTIYAVNKAGITATNLVEQAEQELRHILTDYPFVAGTNIRSLENIKETTVDLGVAHLYSVECAIRYTRVNTDYSPATPNITYSPIYVHDGDETASLTLTDGGGTTTKEPT